MAKKVIITHVDKDGKPKVAKKYKGVDKYTTYNINLPRGQEGFNLYVISDVYINSRDTKVHLKKLTEDIEIIKNDPNALVIVNGNLFLFDDAVFGFDKGQLIPDAFLKHVIKSAEVKKELAELELININSIDRENANSKEELEELEEQERINNELLLKGYERASDEAKMAYIINQIQSDPDFQKSDFFKTNKKEIVNLLQRKLYEPYVKDYVKLFKKINDKIAVINPGNEEEKVGNFRQYNPLYDVATKLDKLDSYSDSVFWLLNIRFNSHLTDNRDQYAMYMGAYGILNANQLSSLQTKIATIYDGFTGFDGQIISGYETNAHIKEEAIFINEDGNPVLKPKNTFCFAGYRKIRETNKVRLQSYIVERDLNRTYASITYARNASYITDKLIDNSGNVIDYNNEKFLEMQKAVQLQDDEDGVILTKPIEPPYRTFAHINSMYVESEILKNAHTQSTAKVQIGLSLVEAIVLRKKAAKQKLDEAINSYDPNNVNTLPLNKEDYALIDEKQIYAYTNIYKNLTDEKQNEDKSKESDSGLEMKKGRS